MALSKLSSAFNLESVKGYFPHRKNTHQLYSENIEEEKFPEAELYDPDFMSEEARSKFLEWHTEQVKEGKTFHLRSALLHYCRQDVSLLR